MKPFYRNSTLAKALSIFIGSLPALVFLLTQPELWSVQTEYVYFTNFGRLFGLLGIGFFALNLLLSGRYKFLDVMFDGLDKLYLFHRRIGQIAFLFLTMHMLLITSRNIFISPDFYFEQLFVLNDIPQNIGKLTYLGMLVIIGITLFWKGKYEIIKKLHRILGFLLFFGGLHAFTMKIDLFTNPYLQVTVFIIVTTALISYTFRTLLEKRFVKRYKGEVLQVNPIGGTVNEVVVELRDPKFYHMPGQFAWITFTRSNIPVEQHPFTISSGNDEDNLRFSIKMSGDFTSEVIDLKKGSQVELVGPYGGFTNAFDEKDQVWVAGGIGITPFMSMVRSIDGSEEEYTKQITLLYSYRGEEDRVFIEELSGYAEKHEWFELVLCDTTERERFALEEVFKGKELSYYICGPSAMIRGIASQLRKAGVKNRDIHYELFKLY